MVCNHAGSLAASMASDSHQAHPDEGRAMALMATRHPRATINGVHHDRRSQSALRTARLQNGLIDQVHLVAAFQT